MSAKFSPLSCRVWPGNGKPLRSNNQRYTSIRDFKRTLETCLPPQSKPHVCTDLSRRQLKQPPVAAIPPGTWWRTVGESSMRGDLRLRNERLLSTLDLTLWGSADLYDDAFSKPRWLAKNTSSSAADFEMSKKLSGNPPDARVGKHFSLHRPNEALVEQWHELPRRMQDQTSTHLRHYLHSTLSVSWLVDPAPVVPSALLNIFWRKQPMSLTLKESVGPSPSDSRTSETVDRLLDRLKAAIAELGYEAVLEGRTVVHFGVNVRQDHRQSRRWVLPCAR